VRRLLQALALVVSLGSAILWLVQGANRGWTKTSVPVKTVDEVTGIEGITYENRFVPGVDFLGVGLLAGAMLSAGSLFIPSSKTNNSNKNQEGVV
jgi:hypothetical protein